MKLRIELDREVDGRWIAEVPELNVLLYGSSKLDAIAKAESAAREIVLTGSPTANSLPTPRMRRLTSLHEFMALG